VRNRTPPSAIISKKLEGFFQKSRGVNANSVKRVALQICLLERSGATRYALFALTSQIAPASATCLSR
jgi:hypothetical protein